MASQEKTSKQCFGIIVTVKEKKYAERLSQNEDILDKGKFFYNNFTFTAVKKVTLFSVLKIFGKRCSFQKFKFVKWV